MFPLGDTAKPQVRAEAAARGLRVADKPDSHDICFIPDGDTRGFLAGPLGERPGELVDAEGRVVGPTPALRVHRRPAPRARAGPRRPDGEPRYVLGVEARTNTVVIGTRDLLGVDAIVGGHARWCGPAPDGVAEVGAQLRAHGEEHAATAWADGDTVHVRLAERARGVAPGQSVVLYAGTRVVGSATIQEAFAAASTP